MIFDEGLAVAQVTLIPLIISVIGVAKRLIKRGSDDLWFGLSLVLGVGLQVTYYLVFVGLPEAAAQWFTLVVIGVAFGLASGKAYDEQKARRNNG